MSDLDFKRTNIMFHGIGQNLIILESIIKNGILSAMAGNDIIGNAYNTNISSRNSTNQPMFISVKDKSNRPGELSISNNILKSGMFFVISGVRAVKPINFPKYKDERLVWMKIPIENIEAIVLNEEFAQKRIRDIDIFATIGDWENLIIAFVNFANLLGISETEMRQCLKDRKHDVYLSMNNLITNYLEKYYQNVLKKQNVCVKDVVDYLNRTVRLKTVTLKSEELRDIVEEMPKFDDPESWISDDIERNMMER